MNLLGMRSHLYLFSLHKSYSSTSPDRFTKETITKEKYDVWYVTNKNSSFSRYGIGSNKTIWNLINITSEPFLEKYRPLWRCLPSLQGRLFKAFSGRPMQKIIYLDLASRIKKISKSESDAHEVKQSIYHGFVIVKI